MYENSKRELPSFPIGPILEYYGFDEVEDGRGWRTVRCAFHGERDASASVRTDDEQVFVCHACGMKGNACQLIMKKESIDYWASVKRAEEIAGSGNGNVRQSSGSRSSLSREKGDRQSVRAYKRTWGRG